MDAGFANILISCPIKMSKVGACRILKAPREVHKRLTNPAKVATTMARSYLVDADAFPHACQSILLFVCLFIYLFIYCFFINA